MKKCASAQFTTAGFLRSIHARSAIHAPKTQFTGAVIDRQPALKAFANRSERAFLMIAKTSFRRLKNALNALGDPGEPEAEGA